MDRKHARTTEAVGGRAESKGEVGGRAGLAHGRVGGSGWVVEINDQCEGGFQRPGCLREEVRGFVCERGPGGCRRGSVMAWKGVLTQDTGGEKWGCLNRLLDNARSIPHSACNHTDSPQFPIIHMETILQKQKIK